MRLRNIYVMCKENLHIIDSLTSTTYSHNSNYVSVDGWEDILNIYEKLSSIEYIKKELSDLIKSVPEIYRHQHSFKVTNSEWSNISRAQKNLSDRMVDAINLYESLNLCNEESMGIDIKLPKCNDFSDFKKYITELEFILYKCPFFKIEDELLKFQTVDVGSMWLNFLIAGTGANLTSKIANNIAAFVDKCLTIKSHKLTIEQQKIQLETMKMEQVEKQNLLNGLNRIFQAQVDDIISELENETGIKLKDGEERGLVSQSFEKANALIDKGMQLYTTIDSPKEIQTLFEPLKTKYLSIEENLKLLEKKENSI